MISQKIRKVASITGLLLGAFALSAIASDWGPAGCAAPGCNTGAPINVTITPQHKAGPLAVGKASDPTTGFDLDVVGVGFFGGVKVGGALEVIGNTKLKTLQIGDATPSGDKQVGYVLSKKDENGTVEWKASANLVGTIYSSADLDLNDANYNNKKCGDVGGICSLTQDLGTQGFCALTRQSVVVRPGGNFNDGDQVNCVVGSSAGRWTLSATRNSGNTDTRILCRASCFGGGAITATVVAN